MLVSCNEHEKCCTLLIVTSQHALSFSWQRIGFDYLNRTGFSEAFEKKYQLVRLLVKGVCVLSLHEYWVFCKGTQAFSWVTDLSQRLCLPFLWKDGGVFWLPAERRDPGEFPDSCTNHIVQFPGEECKTLSGNGPVKQRWKKRREEEWSRSLPQRRAV